MRSGKKHRKGRACTLGGPREKVIGYCHLHKCRITVRQMKARQCLQKQCGRLQRYEEHPYWVQRAKQKAEKKERKRERHDLQALPTPAAGL